MAYTDEDEKLNSGGLYDPNRSKTRYNTIAGLRSYVDQNQNQTGPNTVATKVTQSNNVNKNTNQAQTDKTGYVVQTGAGIAKDVQNNIWSPPVITKVAPTKIVGDPLGAVKNNFGGPPASDPNAFTPGAITEYINKANDPTYVPEAFETSSSQRVLTDSLAELTAQADILKGNIKTQGEKIDAAALEDLKKLNAQIEAVRTKLASYSTSTSVADIGATNSIEDNAMNMADGLNEGMGNIGFLQNTFGGKYDAGKFGALDGQIYNQQINEARDNSEASALDAKKGQLEKTAGVQSYLGALKKGRTDIDQFGTDFTKRIGDEATAAKSTFGKQVKGIDDKVARETERLSTEAKDYHASKLAGPKQAKEAKLQWGADWARVASIFGSEKGDFGSDKYNPFGERARLDYEKATGTRGSTEDIAKWAGERQSLYISDDIERARELLRTDPNNVLYKQMLTSFRKAYDKYYAEKDSRLAARRFKEAQEKADDERRKKESAAAVKADKEVNKGPTAAVDKESAAQTRAIREKNKPDKPEKTKAEKPEKAEKADKSKV